MCLPCSERTSDHLVRLPTLIRIRTRIAKSKHAGRLNRIIKISRGSCKIFREKDSWGTSVLHRNGLVDSHSQPKFELPS